MAQQISEDFFLFEKTEWDRHYYTHDIDIRAYTLCNKHQGNVEQPHVQPKTISCLHDARSTSGYLSRVARLLGPCAFPELRLSRTGVYQRAGDGDASRAGILCEFVQQ